MTKTDSLSITLFKTPLSSVQLRILEDISSSGDDDDVEENVGRMIWPTAMPLLRHMIMMLQQQQRQQPNKEESLLAYGEQQPPSPCVIVELGAGCGLLGMALAVELEQQQQYYHHDKKDTWPKAHFILTDHDDEWLQRNVDLNEKILLDFASTTNVQVTKLDWRNANDIARVQHMVEEKVSAHAHNNPCFLTIIGSDILYNHDTHEALAFTLYQLSQLSFASSTTTRIILAFPDRDNDEASFASHARTYFGNNFPSSEPLLRKRDLRSSNTDSGNSRQPKMGLRVIDFTVDGHACDLTTKSVCTHTTCNCATRNT